MRLAALGLVVCLFGNGSLPAQTLTVPGPVFPGTNAPVTLQNNGLAPIFYVGTLLFLMTEDGHRILPEVAYRGDVISILPGGSSLPIPFAVPATGPGSFGSYVLWTPWGNGAAVRLDVGTQASVPAITGFPWAHGAAFLAHEVDFSNQQAAEWVYTNTSPQPFTFGAAATLRILDVTGTPLAVQSLAGTTVPGGGIARVFLPLAGVGPGPVTVETSWVDPLVGPRTVRNGIRDFAGGADLVIPSGRSLPLGGALEARLHAVGLTPNAGLSMQYAFLVGATPGATFLPNGVNVPLAVDPLVLASLNSGLFGLLQGHLGFLTERPPNCFCAVIAAFWSSPPITLQHPNDPAVSGLSLRVAGIAWSPGSGFFAASQGEEIVLQ